MHGMKFVAKGNQSTDNVRDDRWNDSHVDVECNGSKALHTGMELVLHACDVMM